MKEKIITPYAPVLIDSIRSIGYSFESAVADIIDNSISASANTIGIWYSSIASQWLCIEDDGWGMTQDELENAMRYGSQNSIQLRRIDDLGRFGLGLKTASLSQCRKLTVVSKKNGIIHGASWSLDYIIKQKNWSLKCYSEKEVENLPRVEYLKQRPSGTIVIWEDFDRLKLIISDIQKIFDEKISITKKHIELIFHRFLNTNNQKNKLNITFNGVKIKGIDPFLTKHPATQPLAEQIVRINEDEIRVKPYVLPFISKLTKKEMNEIGGKEELRQNQGFYIYRNKRLIIWGTWFRLVKQNELGKLARIRVDIPNTLDYLWEIDIKKSRASLPLSIKKALIDIIERTVGRSERVYKYRGRNLQTDDLIHIWNAIKERDCFQYKINRDHPIIKILEENLTENGYTILNSFIKIIEDSFPYSDVYYRMAKNECNIMENKSDKDEIFEIGKEMINEIKNNGGDVSKFLSMMDKIDFFIKHEDIISKLREIYTNE